MFLCSRGRRGQIPVETPLTRTLITIQQRYLTLLVLFDLLEHILTHSQTTNLRLSKLKEFADDYFKFDENGRKLSKRVENTVGEIACYEQFLLFPQGFQKSCFPGASKGVIVWEWVKVPIAAN